MTPVMTPRVTDGDILEQSVDVIVNAWNRNVIPWWLLLPQGVAGAIKRRGGREPFREVARHGPIPLGGAVLTGAGRLPFKGIIHVAGINLLWFATNRSIGLSVESAMNIVRKHGFRSIAFPIIGSGSGNRRRDKALAVMLDAFQRIDVDADVVIVRYRSNARPSAG